MPVSPDIKRKRKTRTRVVVAVLLAVIVPPVVVPNFAPVSGINNGFVEIDIMTGRIRHLWKIWYVTVWNKIEDSELTKALTPEDLCDVEPRWKRAGFISPPLTLLHGCILNSYAHMFYEIHTLPVLWSIMELKHVLTGDSLDEFKRKSAKDILLLWQEEFGHSVASDYLKCLDNMFSENTMQPEERDAQLKAFLALNIVETKIINGESVKIFYYPDGRKMERGR